MLVLLNAKTTVPGKDEIRQDVTWKPTKPLGEVQIRHRCQLTNLRQVFSPRCFSILQHYVCQVERTHCRGKLPKGGKSTIAFRVDVGEKEGA